MDDFSGKLYAEDLGRAEGLLTTDRGELWNASPYDYQQRGNATAMNLSPQNLYNNSIMGNYMDSIMGGVMNNSPFMQGGGAALARPPQQQGGLTNQRPQQMGPVIDEQQIYRGLMNENQRNSTQGDDEITMGSSYPGYRLNSAQTGVYPVNSFGAPSGGMLTSQQPVQREPTQRDKTASLVSSLMRSE